MAKVVARATWLPRSPQFNPYPSRFRLPGERTPARQQLPAIEGNVRRCIAHALTFHEIPQNVDALIDRLPSAKKLLGLNALRRDYLSFTVYSLKQMVAARTISANTAWSLFFGEWKSIEEVEEGNFIGMRRAFMRRTYDTLAEEMGPGFIDSQRKQHFENERGEVDLLRFEFLARGGEAGLAQYERYSRWAENLIFFEDSCKDMSAGIREEYRKALWLEMRIIEGQVRINGLNDDIRVLNINDKENGQYWDDCNYFRGVCASIDIFKQRFGEQKGGSVDSTIKAEVGHWLFAVFNRKYTWVSELADRMNMSGYTEKICPVFEQEGVRMRDTTPEILCFYLGGYFLSSRMIALAESESAFPTFPQEFPKSRGFSAEEHEVAESYERLVRYIINANLHVGTFDDNKHGIYQIYRKIGLYISLLYFEKSIQGEELSLDEAVSKIRPLDLAEIDAYCSSAKERMLQLSRTALHSSNPDEIYLAVGTLARLDGLDNLKELGAALRHEDFDVRMATMNGLIGLFVRTDDSRVVPVLKQVLNDEGFPDPAKLRVARHIAKQGDEEAEDFIQRKLNNGKFRERVAAASALIDLRGLSKGTTEYNRLAAYQLMHSLKWSQVEELGEAAISALEAALSDSNIASSFREEICALLQRIKTRDS
ncbi:MAG: HEAT repeat domain-containing protein [Candidatus Margulisbacteria bacterium]|nr:HEAT repeat domain-containing protein [Candidatus Margulisiibacteriota bacterium]MBU1022488.1 HEAT repeat domain-containing protein [Candidatus Margulisiibacteriota bacterium]MBU1728472.1 HEAT repeat domain-containing protein [Candidatus Margulisiibacteriota bacterium]MBU1954619.1 HEAT repeat domain-containing protein [Candidatus Margulisiibacteriota bacterium]